jgi:hypothetical protein
MVAKNILPILKESDYPLQKDMINCSLEIPRLIAEAHSARFDSKELGLALLDQAMTGCNKMVVYLEQARDIYTQQVDRVLVEELIKKYVNNRRKIFHLYKAWKRFLDQAEQKDEKAK